MSHTVTRLFVPNTDSRIRAHANSLRHIVHASQHSSSSLNGVCWKHHTIVTRTRSFVMFGCPQHPSAEPASNVKHPIRFHSVRVVPQDRTDREILMPWIKFLWEAYRTALDITRSNVKLEVIYHDTAKKAFGFCQRYQRSHGEAGMVTLMLAGTK